MIKGNVENQFVAHGKIDFFHLATIESHGSQRHIIDFGSIEITIIENTIDKSDGQKHTLREITVIESATFEFLEIGFFLAVSKVIVFNI